MSIDLNWETLTTGPDGIALAETIRDFIHDKFQTVTLPRFIKKVSVHAFEFGSTAPEIEIKDICDPLPDFYEENEGDDIEEEEEEIEKEKEDVDDDEIRRGPRWRPSPTTSEEHAPPHRQSTARTAQSATLPPAGPDASQFMVDAHPPIPRPSLHSPTELGNPFFRAGTPGISGGTSNLSSFHSHLATGLSGTQTPLAAVAGAHLPRVWLDSTALLSPSAAAAVAAGRSSSANSLFLSPQPIADSSRRLEEREREAQPVSMTPAAATGEPTTTPPPPRRFREPRVEDLQTVFRVRYSGDVRLSLTADILLDYPMQSFVGIPVRLNITGLSFDGVALLAAIRRRAHFCFLSPEDARAAIGSEGTSDEPESSAGGSRGLAMGGLLQEIKVESEIGQREHGKQSLRNVGKVEKFVLEQVRRLFEDELVYPSFWTFLV